MKLHSQAIFFFECGIFIVETEHSMRILSYKDNHFILLLKAHACERAINGFAFLAVIICILSQCLNAEL